MAPLSGMLVLDLCRLLPGDFATWVLADLGAEVIKVEDHDGGDYMRWMQPMVGHSSAMYRAVNRGKRSIRLDLKEPAGKEVLLRLVDRADVLVEGFRPGVMDRLGLGYAELSVSNPHLVYCAITGYGQDGPYAHRAGHDLDYISLTGLQHVTGTAAGELAVPGFQVADMGGGGMGGALSVVAALLARERDPERAGSFMDVSMFDLASAFFSPHLAIHLAGGGSAGPARMPLNGAYPCYHLYRTGDGRWLALAALEPKFWAHFCELAERPELLTRQFDSDAIAEVETLFVGRDRADWLALVEGGDCCLEPVNDLAEAVADPHFLARGLLLDGGELAQPAPVVRLPDRFNASTRVAAQGEDTEAVLAELGYSPEEVRALGPYP
ncbi:MAG: CaiB/BaiF CoA transferase family protein [Candidatus Dormibacteria bacterium]